MSRVGSIRTTNILSYAYQYTCLLTKLLCSQDSQSNLKLRPPRPRAPLYPFLFLILCWGRALWSRSTVPLYSQYIDTLGYLVDRNCAIPQGILSGVSFNNIANVAFNVAARKSYLIIYSPSNIRCARSSSLP
jgi:hypothetical protein